MLQLTVYVNDNLFFQIFITSSDIFSQISTHADHYLVKMAAYVTILGEEAILVIAKQDLLE